jgi:hypothetical protein
LDSVTSGFSGLLGAEISLKHSISEKNDFDSLVVFGPPKRGEGLGASKLDFPKSPDGFSSSLSVLPKRPEGFYESAGF